MRLRHPSERRPEPVYLGSVRTPRILGLQYRDLDQI